MDQTIAGIPGLAGFVAQREQAQQQDAQQVQQLANVQTLQEHFQQAAELSKARQILQSEKDPEKVIPALMQIGPTGAAMANQYASALKQAQTVKMMNGLGGAIDMNNPDALLRASMIPGMEHLGPEAERLRKLKENQAALATMRGTPQALPAGSDVPNTNLETTQEIPPQERAAFNRVAVATAQGRRLTSGQEPGDVAPTAGGLFDTLSKSPIPAIADQAKVLQARLEQSGNSIPAQHWQDLQARLANQEALYLQQQNRPQDAIAKLKADLKAGRISQDEFNARRQAVMQGGDPDTVDSTAKMIAEYRIPPLSGFALRTPWGQSVMAKVGQINPDYNANEFNTRRKAEVDFGTGKQGNTVRSFNVAISHLGTLEELTDALGNGDIRQINRLGNFIAGQTGATAPTNFNAAKKIVADEIVKAIVGSGGGVTDREKAQEAVSAAQSPDQLKGVIQTYKSLMSGQLDGLRMQYEASTRKNDFDQRYLSSESRSEIAKVRAAHQQAASPAAAPQQSYPTATGPNGAKLIFKDGKWQTP